MYKQGLKVKFIKLGKEIKDDIDKAQATENIEEKEVLDRRIKWKLVLAERLKLKIKGW